MLKEVPLEDELIKIVLIGPGQYKIHFQTGLLKACRESSYAKNEILKLFEDAKISFIAQISHRQEKINASISRSKAQEAIRREQQNPI